MSVTRPPTFDGPTKAQSGLTRPRNSSGIAAACWLARSMSPGVITSPGICRASRYPSRSSAPSSSASSQLVPKSGSEASHAGLPSGPSVASAGTSPCNQTASTNSTTNASSRFIPILRTAGLTSTNTADEAARPERPCIVGPGQPSTDARRRSAFRHVPPPAASATAPLKTAPTWTAGTPDGNSPRPTHHRRRRLPRGPSPPARRHRPRRPGHPAARPPSPLQHMQGQTPTARYLHRDDNRPQAPTTITAIDITLQHPTPRHPTTPRPQAQRPQPARLADPPAAQYRDHEQRPAPRPQRRRTCPATPDQAPHLLTQLAE